MMILTLTEVWVRFLNGWYYAGVLLAAVLILVIYETTNRNK